MHKRDFKIYLKDVIDSSNAIFEYIAGKNFDDFKADRKTYQATLREFEIIGEAIKKIPESILKKYEEIKWRDIVDFRNLLIQGYFGIDLEIVWNAIHQDLKTLIDTVKTILEKNEK